MIAIETVMIIKINMGSMKLLAGEAELISAIGWAVSGSVIGF